jgi:tRNA (guanine26-N2/guanine27-N2)-dimethyltransferase
MSTEIHNYDIIVEGSASMKYEKEESVFYNKIQVLNRDLSIQVIKLFSETIQAERNSKYQEKLTRYERDSSTFDHPPYPPQQGISILDALAATGLRSVRYLKEIPNVRHVTINDLEEVATLKARENVLSNGIDPSKVTVHNGDATLFMYLNKDPLKQFDVIDLDPYGSASPFLDAAVQAVSDGGLLCVTCTDMTVLAGNFPEVCFAKYGGVPLKARYTHEMALRILLHSIDSAANRYKRHIDPWISMSIDYYVRVFVRVHTQPQEVKRSCLKTSYVLQSSQCPSFWLQPIGSSKKGNYSAATFAPPSVCDETGGRLNIGGPMWSAPIHRQEIVDELLNRINKVDNGVVDKDTQFPPATAKRLRGLLTVMSEELKDVPLFYYLPDLASVLHSKVPTVIEIQSAIVNAGYRVSQFHHEPHAIKTDAPQQLVWDIMRSYCKMNPPVGSKHRTNNAVSESILGKAISTVIDFTPAPSVLEKRALEVARFPPNPEDNWGPKRKAGKSKKEKPSGVEDDAIDYPDNLKRLKS